MFQELAVDYTGYSLPCANWLAFCANVVSCSFPVVGYSCPLTLFCPVLHPPPL